jgi:hypothetical protein
VDTITFSGELGGRYKAIISGEQKKVAGQSWPLLIKSGQNNITSGQICWPLMSKFFVVLA